MVQSSYLADCGRMLRGHIEVVRLLEAKLLTSSATVDYLRTTIRFLKAVHVAFGVLLRQLN